MNKKIFDTLMQTKVINSIIVIIISIVLYKIITGLLRKSEERSRIKLFTSSKGKTYVKLINSIIRYIFIIATVLILLQVNGINISSVLAGVGVLGVVFGLAIQDWLKDIIRGTSILSDNYFKVGDIVSYKGVEGKVLVIGLKTTKIQELKTGYIKSIANRNIDEIDIVSDLIYINVPMPYELSVEKSEEVIRSIVDSINKNDNVNECEYVGVNELADSFINYYLKVKCNTINKLQVKRDALRTILVEMEKRGVSVPYTQIDIHNK